MGVHTFEARRVRLLHEAGGSDGGRETATPDLPPACAHTMRVSPDEAGAPKERSALLANAKGLLLAAIIAWHHGRCGQMKTCVQPLALLGTLQGNAARSLSTMLGSSHVSGLMILAGGAARSE